MLITKLIEKMKCKQGISFLLGVESIIKRGIKPYINYDKIKLLLKRSKLKAQANTQAEALTLAWMKPTNT